MADWVRATIDNTGEVIHLNLSLAYRMDRPPDRIYTSIYFDSGRDVTVKETPSDLLGMI